MTLLCSCKYRSGKSNKEGGMSKCVSDSQHPIFNSNPFVSFMDRQKLSLISSLRRQNNSSSQEVLILRGALGGAF